MSGDVELHPGPVRHLCAICSRPVASTGNHRALQCDQCYFWCHIKCVEVSPYQYNELIGSVTSWICPPCGTMQFRDSFFSSSDSDLETSNSFSALSYNDSSLTQVPCNQHSTAQPKRKKPLIKIMNMNCNSLVSDNKHALLANTLEEHKPDVLCVCESKLDSTISESAVLPENSGYDVVSRKDNRLGAGGVLIAVKNTFVASPVTNLDTDCEITWSRIELANNKPLFIG